MPRKAAKRRAKGQGLAFRAMKPRLWPDLEAVFAGCGVARQCWCMWWRLAHADYRGGLGRRNRDRFGAVVASGKPTGVLAYRGGVPAGWVAIAPRSDYPRLARAKATAPVDDMPVWSITCFVVHRDHRRSGLMTHLIAAAVASARRAGAQAVEAYPVETPARLSASSVYTGLAGPFLRLGFKEVGRPVPRRPTLRLRLTRKRRRTAL